MRDNDSLGTMYCLSMKYAHLRSFFKASWLAAFCYKHAHR